MRESMLCGNCLYHSTNNGQICIRRGTSLSWSVSNYADYNTIDSQQCTPYIRFVVLLWLFFCLTWFSAYSSSLITKSLHRSEAYIHESSKISLIIFNRQNIQFQTFHDVFASNLPDRSVSIRLSLFINTRTELHYWKALHGQFLPL